jgi:hypothetical protein
MTLSVVYSAIGRFIVTPPPSATATNRDGSGTRGRETTGRAPSIDVGSGWPTFASGTTTRSL